MNRLLVCLLMVAGPVWAEDQPRKLEAATIIGDRELPKILYIVPWRPPEMSTIMGRPISLLDETLAPLDREEFKRRVEYYETLHTHKEETPHIEEGKQ